MQVVYTGEEMPETITKSLFLAGPTPRNKEEQESWRGDALDILRDKGFDGVVFIPEPRSGKFTSDYEDQVGWEEKHLNVADCIVFWVPRDLSLDSKDFPKMAAFTTNVEYGAWANSGKIVFGAPERAPKNDYLKHYAEEYNVPISETLTETLENAMAMVENGAERTGGERYVPLFVWKLDSFQSWYKAQIGAGNHLDIARLLYTFRPGYRDFVFLWVLKACIYVAKEDRYKYNEIVVSRPDISSVCLYWRSNHSAMTTNWEVIFVKEFRSPASTENGFILELPSGSSTKETNPEEVAVEELHEETGFFLDPSRLKSHGKRQLAGTFSSHKAHLYSAELTKKELEWFKSQDGVTHGNSEDTERTFIEVHTIEDIINNNLVDWTTLGMIYQIINSDR